MVTKKSRFDRLVELNDAAMIYSLVARITERIPFVKDLVKRLKSDMILQLDCGFLVSDTVPSEAAYLRMVTILSDSNVLEDVKETILYQAITEGFVTDDTVAIDATHFEPKIKSTSKERKSKMEWLKAKFLTRTLTTRSVLVITMKSVCKKQVVSLNHIPQRNS